ncbi:MAG: helix-turn-helix transcriptional regulator [Burkholderiales bacterium]|nr:helix-turn-helix transcriptional regulator [Burkholderiales bacterium]
MWAYRRRHGLSTKAAAERLGVDEGTWGAWERTGIPCGTQLHISGIAP